MSRYLLRHLRRNLVAYLALFLALTSTGYAASSKLLPKNSVGSAQVINGSLRTADLSTKARTALKGNRGLRGLAGAKGDTGARGATGPAGPASAYFADVNGSGMIDDASPGVAASRLFAGQYTVTFPNDVSRCGATATIGLNAHEGTGGVPNSVLVNLNYGDVHVIQVGTYSGATGIDESFHLVVVC
jgi:hypothetical protein